MKRRPCILGGLFATAIVGVVYGCGVAPDAESARAGLDAKGPNVDSLVATCGDGIRQASEECDEGAAAGTATFCSQRCRVRDLLAVAPVSGDAGLSVAGRTVGAGRHPVAAGDLGIAAAPRRT